MVRLQNCSSFASLWFERWIVWACKCAAMWVGVAISLILIAPQRAKAGRKKQNKFIQFAPTYQGAKFHLSIIYLISILQVPIKLLDFLHLLLTFGAMSMWRVSERFSIKLHQNLMRD